MAFRRIIDPDTGDHRLTLSIDLLALATSVVCAFALARLTNRAQSS